jgi:hypothetical protein
VTPLVLAFIGGRAKGLRRLQAIERHPLTARKIWLLERAYEEAGLIAAFSLYEMRKP